MVVVVVVPGAGSEAAAGAVLGEPALGAELVVVVLAAEEVAGAPSASAPAGSASAASATVTVARARRRWGIICWLMTCLGA
ncbi:MAG: hypothetical protein JO179_10975 [Solirubrobacterales bacterium]|nr:hypothetical protein [Solirubrobacterales bacterium]